MKEFKFSNVFSWPQHKDGFHRGKLKIHIKIPIQM